RVRCLPAARGLGVGPRHVETRGEVWGAASPWCARGASPVRGVLPCTLRAGAARKKASASHWAVRCRLPQCCVVSRHAAHLIALLAAATSRAPAQSMVEEIVVRHAQPLDDAQLNERLVSVSPSESDPRLSLIRWHGNELPVHAAKDRVSIGEIAPGLYVALVGGVRRSLDVYFLEASGAVGRV